MTDKLATPPITPSVLQPQARGGHTALGGFDFQLAVLLTYLPGWLAHDGFTSLSWEMLGDIEAKFFSPSHGMAIECVEAKNHALTAPLFWDELRRFRDLAAGAPGTYGRFVLAVAGLPPALDSAIGSLRRLRDAVPFYGSDSAIGAQSYREWAMMAGVRDRADVELRFLAERVIVDSRFSRGQAVADAPFVRELIAHLPDYGQLAHGTLVAIQERLIGYIRARPGVEIIRAALLAQIATGIDVAIRPPERGVTLYTAHQPEPEGGTALHFAWAEFFGGTGRAYPPAAQWQAIIVGQLSATRAWVRAHRPGARIGLSGSRRLSTTFAIGATFSAVDGFAIDMAYRDQQFSTAMHAAVGEDEYPLTHTIMPIVRADELVVSIGVARDIAAEVEGALASLGLTGYPVLHLISDAATTSPGQANQATRRLKEAIAAALVSTGARQVHLFFAGPAFLALFLGHRWNAIARVQCYEWVGAGRYTPTCALP